MTLRNTLTVHSLHFEHLTRPTRFPTRSVNLVLNLQAAHWKSHSVCSCSAVEEELNCWGSSSGNRVQGGGDEMGGGDGIGTLDGPASSVEGKSRDGHTSE